MKWLDKGFLALACYGCLGLGEARAAPAPDPGAAPATAEVGDPEPVIRIEVIADPELPESRAELAAAVHAELQRLLAAAPQLPASVVVAEDRQLRIELFPGPIPGTDDVTVRAEVLVAGEVVAHSETESCMSCTNEQVGQKLFSMLCPQTDGGGRDYSLFAPLPPPPAAPEPVEAEPEPLAPAPAELEGPARGPAPDPMLISGAGLLTAGLAGLGAGVALIIIDERIAGGQGQQELEIVKYRDPGIAVAVLAGAAAIGGAALLGLALQQRKQRDARAALGLAPVLTGTHYGLALSGGF